MLTDLNDVQESDEEITGIDISIDVTTRTEEEEKIEREYTFCWLKEWEKWLLSEFVERRRENTKYLKDSEYTMKKELNWDDPELDDVYVPPEVSDALKEIESVDEVVLQK